MLINSYGFLLYVLPVTLAFLADTFRGHAREYRFPEYLLFLSYYT